MKLKWSTKKVMRYCIGVALPVVLFALVFVLVMNCEPWFSYTKQAVYIFLRYFGAVMLFLFGVSAIQWAFFPTKTNTQQ